MATPLKGPHDLEWTNADGYSTQNGGLDSKGRRITHHTYHNKVTHRHISYDTFEAVWGEEYIEGSGHERDDVTHQTVRRW